MIARVGDIDRAVGTDRDAAREVQEGVGGAAAIAAVGPAALPAMVVMVPSAATLRMRLLLVSAM